MNDIELSYEKLEARIAVVQGPKCDKYDYMIAAFAGVCAGLIDAYFVGAPRQSKLGDLSDKAANNILEKVTDKMLAKDTKIYNELKAKGLKGEGLKKALINNGLPENFSQKGYPEFKDKITYLENKYRVNYDQSTGDKFMENIKLSPDNHHLKSLGHSPDIIGLFVSILDQFTGKSTFIDNGQLVRLVPINNSFELRGGNFIAKLYCGFINWFGHLLSDMCGSHSAKGRGAGIPIPFFELFQFCNFGSFDNGKNDKLSIAEMSVKVFEHGYDLRFMGAMAVPVVVCDLIIKFSWTVRQYFIENKPWKECIPTSKHPDLRWMLIIGNATLCTIDGVDAAIRSAGQMLEFFLHLNIVAWFMLLKRVLKELELRGGFTYEDLKLQYEYLNYKMDEYIGKLEKIDYENIQNKINELDVLRNVLYESNEDAIDFATSEYIKKHNLSEQVSSYDNFIDMMEDDNQTFIL
ncbi:MULTISPECIES: hypothetical protein [unclassified Eubacterium (in: firmicutes)]|uniref:hypothetical protein n=1 Tax=Eubacterium TaxID=1730 RepID=UPI000E5425D3|nr:MULTISPECIES: hypothetical protein [unclassified Eubacterium (in: firmicutes)]RHR73027.1 hypothetical protein DWW68_05460 [Eubacterium sp. AF16-48]RHR80116.1 hypothetical protein DWW50_04635 [Eubacterium sp. AF15-50]